MGWIGDGPAELTCHLFVDADFAGCPYTLKSTAGSHSELSGPNSRFPWAGSSNKITSRADSTPHAEFVSAHRGMKERGIPGVEIWQRLLQRYHAREWKLRINVHEDNTTVMQVAMTGKNPNMTTLERGSRLLRGLGS